MKAKEYLSQAYYLDQRINSKLEQVARLRELSTKATSRATATRVSGTPDRSPLENAIVKLIDLENEVNRDVDRLVDLKTEIKDFIASIENPIYSLILEKRYVCRESWNKISFDMNYHRMWLLKLHGKALLAADDRLAENRLQKDT